MEKKKKYTTESGYSISHKISRKYYCYYILTVIAQSHATLFLYKVKNNVRCITQFLLRIPKPLSKVYTDEGVINFFHCLSVCTGDNLLVKDRGLLLRTGGQTVV